MIEGHRVMDAPPPGLIKKTAGEAPSLRRGAALFRHAYLPLAPRARARGLLRVGRARAPGGIPRGAEDHEAPPRHEGQVALPRAQDPLVQPVGEVFARLLVLLSDQPVELRLDLVLQL